MENNPFQKNNPKRQSLIKPLHETEEFEMGSLRAFNESVANSLNNESFSITSEDSVESVAKTKGILKMSEEDAKNCIQTMEELKKALLTALKLELATIPPYLCGLYTIKDGSNVEAAALIRSVVVEEMLHMVLVANILNAITDPKSIKKDDKLFDVKEIIADYPTPLPGGIEPNGPNDPFKVSLLKFSRAALEEFCTIERPSNPDAPVLGNKTFNGIGQFYQAIRYGLDRLNRETPGGIFIGDPARQIGQEHYYGSGGKIVKVLSHEDAETAIAEIVGQGEGIDGTIATDYALFGEGIEYAHYFKFQEISYGRMYSANDTNFQVPVKSVPTGAPFNVSWSSVYNMKSNPKVSDYASNPDLSAKAKDFNKTYTTLISQINNAVSGDPDALIRGITVMYDLKYKALALLNIPLNDGSGECAGPTFEYEKI